MGMERVVAITGELNWTTIRDRLSAAGHSVQMRMIDNMPAFPDEEPEAGWQELRVSLGAGMITIRREPTQIRVVVWGNADSTTLAHQEAIATACSA